MKAELRSHSPSEAQKEHSRPSCRSEGAEGSFAEGRGVAAGRRRAVTLGRAAGRAVAVGRGVGGARRSEKVMAAARRGGPTSQRNQPMEDQREALESFGCFGCLAFAITAQRGGES